MWQKMDLQTSPTFPLALKICETYETNMLKESVQQYVIFPLIQFVSDQTVSLLCKKGPKTVKNFHVQIQKNASQASRLHNRNGAKSNVQRAT